MPKNTFAPTVITPALYLPTGWDAGWRSAKVAGTPRILISGDSIAIGDLSSNYETNSWPGVLKSGVMSRLGLPLIAEYWANNGFAATGNPWSGGSSLSTTTSARAWHAVTLASLTTSAVYQTYTTPDACTSFDILFNDGFAGTWQFLVDSGTAGGSYNWAISGSSSGVGTTNVNVTVTNVITVNNAANSVIRRLSITGLPNTIHTFKYGWQSAQWTAIMLGAAHYPNTGSGLKIARMVHSAQKLSQFAGASGSGPANVYRLLAGFTPQQDGQTTLGFGFPVEADLAIISCTVNDVSVGAANLSNFEIACLQIVDGLRRGFPNVSVMFLVNAYPDQYSSDVVASGFGNTTLYSQFVGAIYRVAQTKGCAVLNVHSRWGETPFAAGYLPSTDIHPTDAGHADMAAFALSVL